MQTAHSYRRFSSPEQGQGDSERRQTEAAERACREHGWTLSGRSFQDSGVSGFRGKNKNKGELARFLQLVKDGTIPKGDILILEDLDRLSRQKIRASVRVLEEIIEHGVDVYCTMTHRLYTVESLDDMPSLIELIVRFDIAHEESEKKAERARANWQRKHQEARTGKVITKSCPSWLEVKDGKFEIIIERAEVVRRIFRECIEGLGIDKIVKGLNRDGVAPFQTSWSGGFLGKNILRDRRVLGELQIATYGEKIEQAGSIPGYYPSIISEEVFYKAQLCLDKRCNHTGRPGKSPTLFTGLVYHKDSSMVFIKNGKDGRYCYLASLAGIKGKAEYLALPYARFEQCVLYDGLYDMPVDETPPTNKLTGLLEKKSFLDRRLVEAVDSLGENINMPEVARKIAEMKEERNIVENEIENEQTKATAPTIEITQNAIDTYRTTENKEEARKTLKRLLQSFVERIEIVQVEPMYNNHKTIHRNPKRVFLEITLTSGKIRKVWYDDESQGAWLRRKQGERIYLETRNILDLLVKLKRQKGELEGE